MKARIESYLPKSSALLFVLLFVVNLFAEQKQPSFELQVFVEQLASPAKLILTIRNVGGWKVYTAESTDGNFLISGDVTEPSFAFLVLKYKNEVDKQPRLENITELFIENKKIVLKSSGSLASPGIVGGLYQKELESLRKSVSSFRADQLNERKDIAIDFVRSHPDSFVSLYALQDLRMDNSFTLEADDVLPLFNNLSPHIQQSQSGNEFKKDITLAKQTVIGAFAPDFTQQDTLSKNINLHDFKGTYVLIDFWASWCKPCRIENPNLVRAYQAFKDKGFTIIGVSLDQNKANWINAIRKDNLTWTQLSDLKFWKNEVAILYGVKAIPQNFILDPTGKIIGQNIPPQDLISWLGERLP